MSFVCALAQPSILSSTHDLPLAKEFGEGSVLPVFITCDPARDSQAAVKTYLKGTSSNTVL